LGLHHHPADGLWQPERPDLHTALANCGLALAAARELQLPVAFVRKVVPPAEMGDDVRLPAWMPGFEPKRSDMVFDCRMPSCYSNSDFAEMMDAIDGNCAIAGLFAETACLSTLITGFHRNHRPVYLADASASCGLKTVEGSYVPQAATAIISLYAKVMTTQQWIRLPIRKPMAVL
jgi:nicotinamidase-related amidase